MNKKLKSTLFLASLFTLLLSTSRIIPISSEYTNKTALDSSTVSTTSEDKEKEEKDKAIESSETKSSNSDASSNKTQDKPLAKSTTAPSNSRGTRNGSTTSAAPKSTVTKQVVSQTQSKTSSAQESTRTITTITGLKITKEERDLFARLVSAEAAGESFEGKLAVATVVMNRVKSNIFANNITGVIYGKEGGYYQFTPVLDGRINESATSDSIKAVDMVLNGHRSFEPKVMWFLNPSKSSSSWITTNKTFYKSIENHEFYY